MRYKKWTITPAKITQTPRPSRSAAFSAIGFVRTASLPLATRTPNTASSPNNTKSQGLTTPAFCERRFFNVPATFPLPSTPYGIYSIPHAMQFVNTTIYRFPPKNAKSRGSHPRLFASKGDHSSHVVDVAPTAAYIVYHTSLDLSIPLYVAFFYFVDRHTAMAICWIRAAVRTSAAARIITTFSTISNFASSIRSNRRTILCTRSRLAISHPFLFLRFVLLIALRFAIICIYLSITHSIAHPCGKIHRILSPARFCHKLA